MYVYNIKWFQTPYLGLRFAARMAAKDNQNERLWTPPSGISQSNLHPVFDEVEIGWMWSAIDPCQDHQVYWQKAIKQSLQYGLHN